MTWRWTWAKAQVTPAVVSGMVWLVVLALWPAAGGFWLLASIVVVACWISRPAMSLRFGARSMAADDREAVLAALVPLPTFRGRGQPELWVSDRLGVPALAPADHVLIFDQRLLGQVRRGATCDMEVCTHAARAFGLHSVYRSRAVAGVGCFTLPWQIVAAALRPLVARSRRSEASRFVWRARWLFVGLATLDLAGRGLWISVSLLMLAATATVAAPRWSLAWTERLTRMGENDAARHGFGSSEGGSTPPTGRPTPARRAANQVGRR